MNRILIKLYVPTINEQYDIWIPSNRRTYNVILLLIRAIYELSGKYYQPNVMPMLWEKTSAKQYDINLTIKQNNIRNGSEIVLL